MSAHRHGAHDRGSATVWAAVGVSVIMTVFAGIAEFERDLIRERTRAGREAAKRGGVVGAGWIGKSEGESSLEPGRSSRGDEWVFG